MKGNMRLVFQSETKAIYKLVLEKPSTSNASEEPKEHGEFLTNLDPTHSSDLQQNPIREFVGNEFNAHVISVNTGEDVVERITSFFLQLPCAGVIMSASGSISSVVLDHLGHEMSYEGQFGLVSLSWFYQCPNSSGPHIGSGKWTVCLSNSENNLFGGVVAGPLFAATPVQVVVGTFLFDDE